MAKLDDRTDLDQTLIALADPTRRGILEALARGETRVTDVARPFQMSLNSVSKHVRILERAGLVRRRKAGREYLLSLDPGPMGRAADWLRERHAAWNVAMEATDTASVNVRDSRPGTRAMWERRPPSACRLSQMRRARMAGLSIPGLTRAF